MPFRRSVLAAFVSTLGLCASTGAAAESFGFSLGLTQPNQTDPNPAATQTLTFNQFNAALGTLTGVQFTLSSQGSVSAGINVTNFSAGEGGSASGSVAALFGISGPGATPLFSGNGSAAVFCSTGSGSDGCSNTNPSGTAPSFAPDVTLTGPDFSAFIGGGTFDVLVSLAVDAILGSCVGTFGGSGDCTASGAAGWNGTLDVTFLYRPTGQIPEPGSVALLGLGAAALALRRRKDHAPAST